MAHTEPNAERWHAVPSDENDKGGNYRILDERGEELATVWARTDGETAKPAVLLAASPALLAALKKVLDKAERGAPYQDIKYVARKAIEEAS